jgi:chorismate mutase/prephenate dehydratase
MNDNEQLRILRKTIDDIDAKVIALLNSRAEVAKKIGDIKKEVGEKTYVFLREAEIYDNIKKINKGPLKNEALKNIFREIISACRNLQEPYKIFYLGPAGTFTNLAAIRYFGLSSIFIPVNTIKDIFDEVERNAMSFGVVPIENSLEGVVTHSIDMFFGTNLKICGEIFIKVTHNILNKSGNIESIKKIYSHPHAIAQCRRFLSTKFKDIPVIEVESTAKAAEIASIDENVGAIASEAASLIYNLQVVYKEIEDDTNNYTRFIVLGHEDQPLSENNKTSLMFSVLHKAGALYKALEVFSKYNINMSKIESRPSKKKPWDYMFFVDILGHREMDNIKGAITELRDRVSFIKILGSYKQGEVNGL